MKLVLRNKHNIRAQHFEITPAKLEISQQSIRTIQIDLKLKNKKYESI